MTPPEVVPPPPPPAGMEPQPAPSPFNGGLLILGLLLSLFVGGIGNIFFDLMGGSLKERPLAFLVGIIPGVTFMLLFYAARRNGFGHGMLIGGCIIALIGGACGASMVGMSFH